RVGGLRGLELTHVLLVFFQDGGKPGYHLFGDVQKLEADVETRGRTLLELVDPRHPGQDLNRAVLAGEQLEVELGVDLEPVVAENARTPKAHVLGPAEVGDHPG